MKNNNKVSGLMIKKTNKKIKKLLSIKKEVTVKRSQESKEKSVAQMKKTKISVIGIGGGGGSIISEIVSKIHRANFVVANTDIQALKIIDKKVNRFSFGQNLTQGLGTGMNVDLGREAAENEKDRIKKLCQGQDICIIVACLGGGAGSGAAPIFAKISKSLGNLTYGIFTLPFEFEGEKKMEIAQNTIKKITRHLDAITLIPNERIFQVINKDTPLRQALSVINKSLAKNLEGLIETIYEPGLINIDFADFKTIFKNKGKMVYLNTVETLISEERLIKDLMVQILNSPLYPYTIKNAKGVLFNISGEKNLSLSEVNQISKSISELVNPGAKIIFGTCILASKKKTESIIKITLLAIGCEEKESKISKKISKIKIIKKLKNKKFEKKILTKPLIKKADDKLNTQAEQSEVKRDKIIEISTQRTRKSGLQVKKDAQEFEKEILEKEKFWEIPAYLRRKSTK